MGKKFIKLLSIAKATELLDAGFNYMTEYINDDSGDKITVYIFLNSQDLQSYLRTHSSVLKDGVFYSNTLSFRRGWY